MGPGPPCCGAARPLRGPTAAVLTPHRAQGFHSALWGLAPRVMRRGNSSLAPGVLNRGSTCTAPQKLRLGFPRAAPVSLCLLSSSGF